MTLEKMRARMKANKKRKREEEATKEFNRNRRINETTRNNADK